MSGISGRTSVRPSPDEGSLPLIVATILREEGITGVHTHIQQLRRYIEEKGMTATLVTSFSWGRSLSYPVYAVRPLILERCSGPSSVAWYRYWHELFLYRALRRCLAGLGDCVVYAHDPLAARAALRARRGPHQRVVLAVHFQTSRPTSGLTSTRSGGTASSSGTSGGMNAG